MPARLNFDQNILLAFKHPPTKQAYRNHAFQTDWRSFRLASLAGAAMFCGFIVIDQLIHPKLIDPIIKIRLGLVAPLLLLNLGLSYTRWFHHFWGIQLLAILSTLIAQTGHFLLGAIPGIHPYYLLSTSTILLFFTCFLPCIRFRFLLIFCLLVGLVFFYLEFSHFDHPLEDSIFQAAIFTLLLSIGLVAGYLIEQKLREGFIQNEIISLHRKDIAQQNEDLKKNNQTLEQLISQLNTTNRELRQFTYMASHDLKTPVRGISNLMHFLEEVLPHPINNETSEVLDLIKNRIMRLEHLIQGIREYMQATRRTHNEAIDLNEMAKKIAEEYDGPKAQIEVSGLFPVIMANPDEMSQIFHELIENAIRHNPNFPRVEVSSEKTQHQWAIVVQDNGPGIAPKYHQKIFKIFETLSPEDKELGAGVGLAIVKKIVEKYGGSIQVKCGPLGGTCMRILFPSDLLARIPLTEVEASPKGLVENLPNEEKDLPDMVMHQY